MRSVRFGAALGISLMMTVSILEIPSMMSREKHRHREMWVALENGGCDVSSPAPPDVPIKAIFAANFPGSGTKMLWNLIEALTGLPTADEWGYNYADGTAVAIKTHYPHASGHLPEYAEEVPRAIMLLRNPKYTFASLHNFVYEFRNNLPSHSTRAPEDEWIRWRDGNFEQILNQWYEFIVFWMDQYEPKDRLITAYEELVNPEYGAQAASNIAAFIAQNQNVHPIVAESIPCVWRSIVKYREDPRFAQAAVQAQATEQATDQPQAEAQPDQQSGLQPEFQSEPQMEPQMEPQPEFQSEPQPEFQSEPQPEFQPEHQLEFQPEPQPESQPEPPQLRRRLQEVAPSEMMPQVFPVPDEQVEQQVFIAEEPQALEDVPSQPAADTNGYSQTFFNPASIRAGPEEKPYTALQLGMMIDQMQNLKTRYKYDEIFVNTLEAYIRDIMSAPVAPVTVQPPLVGEEVQPLMAGEEVQPSADQEYPDHDNTAMEQAESPVEPTYSEVEAVATPVDEAIPPAQLSEAVFDAVDGPPSEEAESSGEPGDFGMSEAYAEAAFNSPIAHLAQARSLVRTTEDTPTINAATTGNLAGDIDTFGENFALHMLENEAANTVKYDPFSGI